MIDYIANLISKVTLEADVKVTIPEQATYGHYSSNIALVTAKKKSLPPQEVALDIIQKIKDIAPPNFFYKIEVAGAGFINFFLNNATLEEEVKKIIKVKNTYGTSSKGSGKIVVVDFSSPNIAKPMSVGHLRSTVIGASIANLLKAEGYEVITDNHLGDWGTQFGKLIYAWKSWKDDEAFLENPIKHLTDLYIRFHKEAELNASLEDIAREETAKLQRGDKDNLELWKTFVDISLLEFNKIYKRLNIKFDLVLGESFYQPMLEGVVSDALSTNVAKRDDGAVKIFFDDESAQVIEKRDGSYTYTTTDLATIKYRTNKYHPAKVLYVVANEQALHFDQLFISARKLNYIESGAEFKHIKFGMMLGESGKKFSTRKGEFITLEDVLNKAVSEASAINKESAEQVGIGAVKYYDLSHQRLSDIVFNWDSVLDIKGNSSAYLQYTYARFMSILKKYEIEGEFKMSSLSMKEETNLVNYLIRYPDIVAYASERYEPHHLTDYLFQLANTANAFYENCSIGEAKDKEVMNARLVLSEAITIILKNGLEILGIEVMDKM